MPVDTPHFEYQSKERAWRRMRDVLGGEDSVKASRELYIPRLDAQSDLDYTAYVHRGFFYNATVRTREGYLGLIFRKNPVVVSPGSVIDGNEIRDPLSLVFSGFLADVDLMGSHFTDYALKVCGEVLSIGRCGTLVDWHDGSSVSDSGRAFVAWFAAENILNWRSERIDGQWRLVHLVLREFVSVVSGDGFDEDTIEQIRVYDLIPSADGSSSRSVSVSVWQKVTQSNKKQQWTVVETKVPMRRGSPLPDIPFIFHGPEHQRPEVDRSPMDDIAVANLAHFRLDVEHKHGLHFTALPTAWVSGFDKKSELKVGAQTAWVTDQVGATAGYLEFRGDGLRSFERALDRVERLLSVLGTRLLESQKRVAESAEALSIRQSGESSILAKLAVSVSAGLTDVLRWVYWWHSASTVTYPLDIPKTQVCVKLNTDFEAPLLTPDELRAMVESWQAGAISRDTLHYQLTQGEVLPPGRSLEDELARIKSNPPPVLRPVSPPSNRNGNPEPVY